MSQLLVPTKTFTSNGAWARKCFYTEKCMCACLSHSFVTRCETLCMNICRLMHVPTTVEANTSTVGRLVHAGWPVTPPTPKTSSVNYRPKGSSLLLYYNSVVLCDVIAYPVPAWDTVQGMGIGICAPAMVLSSMPATHSASRQTVPGNEVLPNILHRNDLKGTFKGGAYSDESSLFDFIFSEAEVGSFSHSW